MKRSSSMSLASPSKRPKLSRQQSIAVRTAVNQQLARKTEYKSTDTAVTTGIDSIGGVTSLLTSLANGDTGFNDFIGDEITPKWVQVRYSLSLGASATNSYVRVIIGQHFNSTIPTIAQLLETASPYAAKQHGYVKNYRVLHDEFHHLNGVDQYSLTRNVFKKKLGKINYAAGQITKGCLFLAVISTETTNVPVLSYYNRIKFSD